MVAPQHTYRTWLKLIANIKISTICNLKCKQLIPSTWGGLGNVFQQTWKQKNLIKLVCSYFQKYESRNVFDTLLIINSGLHTCRSSKEKIEALPISNDEEAEKGWFFHAVMSNEGADVFLLLIYLWSQLKCFPPPSYMKIDSNHFSNIDMIYYNLGSKTSDVLSRLNAITVCDTRHTTNVGKDRVFKKVCKNLQPHFN